MRRLIALAMFSLAALAALLLQTDRAVSDEDCRQHYNVASRTVYYGCQPVKEPTMQPLKQNNANWDYTQGSDLQKRVCHREIESNSAGTVKVDYCDVTLVPTDINGCKQPDWGHLITDKMITIRQNLQNGGDWNQIFQARIRNIQESQQKAHRELLGLEGDKVSNIPTTVEELACFHYTLEQIWKDDVECMRAGIIDCPRGNVPR